MSPGSDLAIVRERLAQARAITVLTGAGISADSGVPTFRGTDGLWRNYRAEDLATPEAFERDPRLVWEWYNWRRELIASKRPNPAHEAVVELERRCPQFWLITQNVDGLHRAAGSRKISEIHGNIWMVRCTACRSVEENREVPIALLPECRRCGGLLRPHIVWFGESLDSDDLARCTAALRRAARHRDVRGRVSGGGLCIVGERRGRVRCGDQSRPDPTIGTGRCVSAGTCQGHRPASSPITDRAKPESRRAS